MLGLIIFALLGTIAAGTKWSTASWTPNLALDLEGGTQIILTPVAENGEDISSETIAQAIDVIRQRVDSSGVAEAEITSQSGGKIVVGLPGNPSEETLELVRTSAQMAFRPVLAMGNPTPTDTAATPEPTESAAATDPAAPAPTPTPTAAAEEPSDEPTKAAPDNPSDTAYYITPAVQAEFDALDCTDPTNLTGGVNGDPDKAFVTCGQDGSAKYILGPVEIEGARISSATSGLNQLPSGGQGNKWVVNIAFDSQGTTEFTDVTTRLQGLSASPPLNQFAMVLDGLVISAPSLDSGVIIADGKAEISGTFTRESAASLANQLNFGSLPLTFTVESEEQISATLGSEQLQMGLLAGLIGLGLVVVYSLFQYRALGLVTVASLVVAGLLTYSIITLLSWTQGYRLSLPGVAGLIVAIGITADSFIVYFERIRDELREGRTLVAAVDRGWERARRTILASDAVNFLAAIVLYVLAVGSVRGFAFTLGLTTLIDVLVVFMFTHPIMQLIARTKFFGQGHRLSGLDPRRLGAPSSTRYVGRGRVVHGSETSEGRAVEDAPTEVAPADAEPTPRVPVAVGGGTGGLTIAERRAAALAAEQKAASTTDAPVDAPAQESEPESGRTEGNEH
ncbi:protein translocase subunit SecD [Cellulomonas humilata]|uniref:Protein translocase subunit SecD n=1 Tax=Cellulomonas humilata TaxID=144055 RepID=A0ABU0EF31_9CELL|nr:protein translocase subunit SecD [Cellulomonas humilata]MDQ0373872.1 preprotein translocase subunit SecD [Cellulomonas humilata]